MPFLDPYPKDPSTTASGALLPDTLIIVDDPLIYLIEQELRKQANYCSKYQCKEVCGSPIFRALEG